MSIPHGSGSVPFRGGNTWGQYSKAGTARKELEQSNDQGRGVPNKKKGAVIGPPSVRPWETGLLAFRGEPFQVSQDGHHSLGMFPHGFDGGLRRMQSPLA